MGSQDGGLQVPFCLVELNLTPENEVKHRCVLYEFLNPTSQKKVHLSVRDSF